MAVKLRKTTFGCYAVDISRGKDSSKSVRPIQVPAVPASAARSFRQPLTARYQTRANQLEVGFLIRICGKPISG